MLVACTRNSLETYLGDMHLKEFCSIMSFYKNLNFDFYFPHLSPLRESESPGSNQFLACILVKLIAPENNYSVTGSSSIKPYTGKVLFAVFHRPFMLPTHGFDFK